MAELETELKFSLTQEQYRTVHKWLADTGATLTRNFTNHYFDTPECVLRERGYGLRLRVYPHDQTILTLKGPDQSGGEAGLSVRAEWEEKVDPSLASECIHGRRHLESFNGTRPWLELEKRLRGPELVRLGCLGGLSTRRISARRDGFQVELDACTVGSHDFFELEIESPAVDRARTWVTVLFVDLDIPLLPSRITKLGRFFEAHPPKPS